MRDINKTIRWFRNHFGRKLFAPHLRDIINRHLEKLQEHHSVEVIAFKDKHGHELISTLAKVKDIKHFVSLIAGIRDIKKPKLTLGIDGNTNQCVISGIITNADEDKEGEAEAAYNPGGNKRVLMLAKADGVPETYHNVKILLDSLDLPSLSKDFQTVCDLKMINIILGIQSCTSKFGCPYCEGHKVDKHGRPTNKRGRWVKKENRTVNNLTAHFNEFKNKDGNDRKTLKYFKNVEFKPIKLKEDVGDEWVAKTLPPEPLHTNLLGPANDAMDKLEEYLKEKLNFFTNFIVSTRLVKVQGVNLMGHQSKQYLRISTVWKIWYHFKVFLSLNIYRA